MKKGKNLFKEIIIDNNVIDIDAIDAANGIYTFTSDGTHTVEYVLKEETNTIPENFFKDCEKLTYVSVPSQITYIGNNAFIGTDLKEDNLSYIQNNYPDYFQKGVLPLSFAEANVDFTYGDNLSVQEINGLPDGAGLTVSYYDSNNPSVVSIDVNNKLVWNSAGEATITAVVDESTYYLSGVAQYTVTAKKETVQLEVIGFTLFNGNNEECKGQLVVDNLGPRTYEGEDYYKVYFNSVDNHQDFCIGDPYFVKVNTNNIIGQEGIEIYKQDYTVMEEQLKIDLVEGFTFNAYSLESVDKEVVTGAKVILYTPQDNVVNYNVTLGNEAISNGSSNFFIANQEGTYHVVISKEATNTTIYELVEYDIVISFKEPEDKEEVYGLRVKLTDKVEKYEFTSYADKKAETEWATGIVEVTEKTNAYIKVKVLENSIEGFVDNVYYVNASTKIGNIVELKSDAELQTSLEPQVFVKITKDVSEYEFASYNEDGTTQYATGKVQVNDVVSVDGKVWGTESVARAFKDASFLLPETSGAPYNYMEGQKPGQGEECAFDISKFNLKIVDPNDETKEIENAVSFEYIDNEEAWQESYTNGILKRYYEWADSIQPYKEDLWNNKEQRGANWNDIVKENGQPIEYEDGYHYVDADGNPCERCWKGALASAEAHWPWVGILINGLTFDNVFTPIEFGGFPVFEYEGKESVKPWGLKSFGRAHLVPVKVIENSVEGWVNKEFYITSQAELSTSESINLYKLYYKID